MIKCFWLIEVTICHHLLIIFIYCRIIISGLLLRFSNLDLRLLRLLGMRLDSNHSICILSCLYRILLFGGNRQVLAHFLLLLRLLGRLLRIIYKQCIFLLSLLPLLSCCISTKSMLSSESWGERTFLIRIVNGPFWLKSIQECAEEHRIVELWTDPLNMI